jgi:hypothetical protein
MVLSQINPSRRSDTLANFFNRRIGGTSGYCLIASAVFLLSCSKNGQSQERYATDYARPADWKTVCIGRFLIDLPQSAQLGATDTKYKAIYGFKGINTGNAGGRLHYGDVQIRETIPATKADLERIHMAARAEAGSPEVYKKLLRARQEDVKYILDRMASSSAEEAGGYKNELQDRKDAVAEVIFNSKTSGEAKIGDPNGFAVRFGSAYGLGFFDPRDQRIRTFRTESFASKKDTVDVVAEEYRRIHESYHTRSPTDIPTTPGFCTYYGFIDEPVQAEANVQMRVPIQIKQYPNLILSLDIEPTEPDAPKSIQKFPNMDAGRNVLDKIGVKRTHGPKAEQILGTPGRSYAQEYGDNCSSTSCRPADQAYDMEARTFGEAGRVDRPRLILHMTAAASDDYKLKRPAEPKGYNVPDRPSLSGHVPPPFEVGQEIFTQVLRSIRVRPGAIAGQATPSPASLTEQRK